MGVTCEILWNVLSLPQWQEKFQTIARSNILQSYDYALATCKLNRQSARWGLIKINGAEAGLVQIIEARTAFGLLHALILDRGPLWFDNFGSAVHIAAFFQALNTEFPIRWGRKRRIIPEVDNSPAAQKLLLQTGLKEQKSHNYQTLWWDIAQKEEDLRQNLSKSWIKSLKKSQNSNIEVVWDDKLKFFNEFKLNYEVDKQMKGYENISPQLLDNFASLPTRPSPIVIGKAMKEGQCIAGVLFLKHGSCATYQVGWTSAAGRQYCAHHALLWNAQFMYDTYGIKTLDLGGITDGDTGHETGLAKFKKGTGASLTTLVGQYA